MLWGIKVPSKVRVFLWRLARCSLPSKDVLLHRMIGTCPIAVRAPSVALEIHGDTLSSSLIWLAVSGR
jgi:hypothetical protein